jgi:putative ABC transport system permease protein
MEAFLHDLRHGLRTMIGNPGFAIVAIVTLALGIGGNAAMFSVVNAVLLQPLPYPDPDRLVELELTSPGGESDGTSVPKFNLWRTQTYVFDAVAAYDYMGAGINLLGGDRPEQLKGIRASADYFRVFGAPIAIGRAYGAEEDRPGGPRVALISAGLWHARFNDDPGVLNRTINLDGEPNLVIGVLGSGFTSDPKSDVWLPLRADPSSTDQGNYLRATARLKQGVTIEQARSAMKAAAEEFKRRFPNYADVAPGESFTAVPLKDSAIGDVRESLLLLSGAVGFVLLIACTNVANLMMVRGTIRQREMAIRAALGAERWRMFSQLLGESLLLAIPGGLLGLGVGFLGLRALLFMNPASIPRIGERGDAVALDWRVLVFTLSSTFVTVLLFGLVPAIVGSRAELGSTLRGTGSRTGGGREQHRARSVLVSVEIALALVLLVGAVLLIRSFGALRTVDPGFDARNVLTLGMSLAGNRFETAAAVDRLERESRRRIESLPGVTAAALTCCLPLEGGFGLPFSIEGQPSKDGPYTGSSGWLSVSPRYFDVFHIPLVKGRGFVDSDSHSAPHVVIVNEQFTRKYFSKSDGVGTQIIIGKGVGPQFEEPPREIVGIVGDVRQGALDQPPVPIMYLPTAQVNDGVIALHNGVGPAQWVVRTAVQPFSVSQDVQRELREASGGLPVAPVRSMQQVVNTATARSDFYTTLLTIFAGVALLLSAIGVYGLMAYSVQQRTREIGLRMALGATPMQLRGMIVLQAMRLTVIGVVLGIGASLALGRFMEDLLYGVKPSDPGTIVVVAILLSAVSLLAAYVPAKRASRVDPLLSLRYE